VLVEGNSLRAASRLADVFINTVTKLLVDVLRRSRETPGVCSPEVTQWR